MSCKSLTIFSRSYITSSGPGTLGRSSVVEAAGKLIKFEGKMDGAEPMGKRWWDLQWHWDWEDKLSFTRTMNRFIFLHIYIPDLVKCICLPLTLKSKHYNLTALCRVNYGLVLYHISTEMSSLLKALESGSFLSPLCGLLCCSMVLEEEGTYWRTPRATRSAALKFTTARERTPDAWFMDLSLAPSLSSSSAALSLSMCPAHTHHMDVFT